MKIAGGIKSHTWNFLCPLSCVLLYLTLYSYFHLLKHEMLCRCSLDDLAIWYIPSTMGGDNKNDFLKTGVNLSYLEFLFEFVLCFGSILQLLLDKNS